MTSQSPGELSGPCPYCFCATKEISIFELDAAVDLGAVALWKWAAEHEKHIKKEEGA